VELQVILIVINILVQTSIVHCVSEKTRDCMFYNNLNSKCPITIILAYLVVKLCVIERWFHLPSHLSTATVFPWEISTQNTKMANLVVSKVLFCD